MVSLHPLKLRAYIQKKIAVRRTRWVGLLPEEMWILIISHTSDNTLNALNRTCRAMNAECSRELDHRKEVKLKSLRHEEGSCPLMVVCSSCVMFHARPSKRVTDLKNLYWEIAPTFSNFDLGGPKCKQNAARVRLAKQDELDWWRVHLAMRSHRFGSMHGPAVGELNKITIRLRGLWTSSTNALVHEDHLLLKVQGFRLLGKGEDYTRHMPCCKHLKSSQAMLHELRRWHDRFFLDRSKGLERVKSHGADAQRDGGESSTATTATVTTVASASSSNSVPSNPEEPIAPATTTTSAAATMAVVRTDDDATAPDATPNSHGTSLLYRCSVCPFEFRLSIGPGDAFTSEAADIVWRNRDLRHDRRSDGFMLCITSYVDLGRCVDPTEPEWSALSGDGHAVGVKPVDLERFHRPTIESRFEHHASLVPLNYDEITIAVGSMSLN